MVVYSILTEQSIGKMFIAGVIPGVLAVLFYMAAVRWVTFRQPDAAPAGPRVGWKERLRSLNKVWAVLTLIIALMGGIYIGFFTPAEAAGMGAFLAFVFSLMRKNLSPRKFFNIVVDSAVTTGMIFFIMIGALMLANFINFTSMPNDLLDAIDAFNISPLALILVICLIYVVLGCVLESMSMILLTVPIFYPLVEALGIDLIWFGIIVEIGSASCREKKKIV